MQTAHRSQMTSSWGGLLGSLGGLLLGIVASNVFSNLGGTATFGLGQVILLLVLGTVGAVFVAIPFIKR